MRALVLADGQPNVVTDYPVPVAQPNEALVRVLLAGICSTDLELMRGYKSGFRGILGHEFVGTVVDAPGFSDIVGQRVVGEINIGCGVCDLCRCGLHKHCRKRRTMGIIGKDGVFAEYATLPVMNLHRVPDSVSNEQAVFTEPLAAACQILEQVVIHAEDRVAVVGDGRLGLLCTQTLAQQGCRVTLFGRHQANLSLMAEFGLEGVLTPREEPEHILAAYTDQFDVVVEASGSQSGFLSARRLVRPAGVIVLKSTFGQPMKDFDSSGIVVDEIEIVGSRCGPFEPALNLLEKGQVNVDPMIHGRFELTDGLQALDFADQSGVLKVLLQP